MSISVELSRPSRNLSVVSMAGRDALVSAVIVGLTNSQYIRVSRQLSKYGLSESIFSTLGISLIVWVAAFAVIHMLLKSKPYPFTILDWSAVVIAFIFFTLPVTGFSAIGLSILGVYFGILGKSSEVRRSMRLLVALAVAVMWGRFAMSFFLPYILQVDAYLASHLTGLDQTRNLILASDGQTLLQVGAGCSSFLNITNAMLGWATAMLFYAKPMSLRAMGWAAASVCMIVAINTLRIGMIGWWPDYFWLIHGGIGSNIANILSSVSILYFSMKAVSP